METFVLRTIDWQDRFEDLLYEMTLEKDHRGRDIRVPILPVIREFHTLLDGIITKKEESEEKLNVMKDIKEAVGAEVTGMLQDWYIQDVGENFESKIIWGKVYGDILKRFPDGMRIHTSALKTDAKGLVEGDIVDTTYSRYLLGVEKIIGDKT